MAENHSIKVKELYEYFSSLHELAANNDLIGFKKEMEEGSLFDIERWSLNTKKRFLY